MVIKKTIAQAISFRAALGQVHPLLVAILVFALLLRLPSVGYGLPLQLYGDEHTNIYGALTLLEERTLLPVLHPDAFVPLLYAPPVTAYIFAATFAPVLAVDIALRGFPAVSAYKQLLTLDQSFLWYIARTLSVFASIANVFLVYCIARRLFLNERAALFSALVLATSFLDVSIAATARHWEFGLFFLLYGILMVLRSFDSSRLRRLVFAGGLLGTAVGSFYVAFLSSLAGLLVLARHRYRFWEIPVLRKLAALIVPSVLVAGMFILVHPYPLFTQSGTSTALARGGMIDFLSYYGWTLFAYDTPLFIASALGLVALFIKRPPYALPLVGSLVVALAGTYLLMPNFVRYLMPTMPLLALLAGYGADAFLLAVRAKNVRVGVVVVLVAYWGLLFGKYEWLLIQGDTRGAAREWLTTYIPKDATVIIDSNTLRVIPTTDAARTLSRAARDSVRGPERAVLAGFEPNEALSAFHLIDPSLEVRAMLTRSALATGTELYLVTDSWWDSRVGYGVVLDSTVTATFLGQGVRPPVSLIHGGQPIDPLPTHVLPYLYSIPSFGPNVTIFKIREKMPL